LDEYKYKFEGKMLFWGSKMSGKSDKLRILVDILIEGFVKIILKYWYIKIFENIDDC
jgi:hypothetical protein